MNRIICLIIAFLNIILLNAQTVFWTESFGTGCSQNNSANGTLTSNGTWAITNVTPPAANANQWFISATEAGMAVGTCGSGCLSNAALTNRTLHIGNVPSSPSAGIFCPTGDCGASYDSGGGCGFGLGCVSMNDRAESPVINCTGQNTITLSFSYLEAGDPGNDYMEVMYSANGGTTWSSLVTPPVTSTSCGSGQGLWTSYSVALPATANNNAAVKIGFRWQNNDDGVGNDPSVAVDSIKLSVPTSTATPLTVSITPSPTTTICQSSTLTLSGSASGTVTAWSWSVTPSAGVAFIPNAASQSVTATFTTSGTYTFTLTATGSSTATATQSITVLPSNTPSVSINANPGNPICAGQTVSFTATPTNGGTMPAYQWQVNAVNAGTNSPNFSSSTLNNNDIVSVTLTSNATCASPTTALTNYMVLVSMPQTPSVSISPNLTGACSGGSATFAATPLNGGTSPLYQWQVNGVNVGTNTATPAFMATNVISSETVSVILTSNAGCVTTTTASAMATVTITPTPTLSITKNSTNTVCPNSPDTIVVTGAAGSVFSWTPAAGLNTTTNDTVIATNAAVGIYTYYVTCTAGGCTSNKDSAIVNVSSTFTASTGLSHTICAGQYANLSATGGTSYTWTPSSTLSCSVCVSPIATPSNTTIYTVTATKGGCTATLTDTVFVNPSAISLFTDTVIVPGVPQTVNFINLSSNAVGYIWNFGVNSSTLVENTSTNTSYTYNAAGTYTVTLIAFGANGCNDTLKLPVVVVDIASLTMPNIFTPNGDGINDVFEPNAHGMKSLTCTIYDRWGIKIIALDNNNVSYWDGHTTSGVECSEGTYFYIVNATDINNKTYNLKGFLQLIK